MLTVKEVRAEGFRGIRSGPALRFGADGLLLLGNNGVGKTSWVDAVEKPLTGKCSTVETGDQTLSWAKHGAHIRSDSSPAVTLVLSDGVAEYEITLQTDSEKLPSRMRALLLAAKQCSFILRRRTLLDFINAKPQDRYKALEGFLNVDSYFSFERGLKGLLQWLDRQVASTQSSVEREETAIRLKLQMPGDESVTETTVLSRLKVLLSTVGLRPAETRVSSPERYAEATTLINAFGDVDALARVNVLEQRSNTLPASESLFKTADEYRIAVERLSAEEQRLTGVFFAEVLSKGLEWIVSDQLTACPLCDSPIDIASVKKAVAEKLSSHQQLTELRNAASQRRTVLLSALRLQLGAFEQVRHAWQQMGQEPPQALPTLISNLIAAERSLASTNDDGTWVHILAPDALSIGLVRQVIREYVLSRKGSFPDQDRYAALFAAREALGAVERFSNLQTVLQSYQKLQAHRQQLHHVMELAEAARKTAVQQLVNQVTSTANAYFEKIHPGEQIGGPLLEVTERGTGSMLLTGEFYGRRGDPRGHYSDGHLDSLGLCLFLAIRRLQHDQHPELALLVLDDVLHSVDAEDRRKTAKLIIEEFSDHQIFITTHDPLWFEYLKFATRGKRFLQQRVASWTIDDGPTLSEYLADYEWLVSKEARAAKPANRVGTAGRVLEETLQNLCNNLNIPVPYRLKGDYTIDPLWNNFMKAARGNAQFFVTAQPALEKIDELRVLRNLVGAHWNEWAQQLTDAEADEFCMAIVELRNAAYCERCGGFIERIAQLDGVWSCAKEHKRYDRRLKAGVTSKSAAASVEQQSHEPATDGSVPKQVM